MIIIIFLTAVFLERSEHGFVSHIMAVDYGVKVRKVGIVSTVEEKCSGSTVFSVKSGTQIVLVIGAFYNGIINNCVFGINPGNYIFIALP